MKVIERRAPALYRSQSHPDNKDLLIGIGWKLKAIDSRLSWGMEVLNQLLHVALDFEII